MKKETVKSNKSMLEIYKSIRGDWGELNPVTRIAGSKKAYNRHKENQKVRQQIQTYLY
ncbi:hypothetical protein J2Z80_000264 [Thermoanaerobacterium butyriciformans]|uniref:Uncharacterized protein n=1 Tax=Thermoanaerobacterium butyriciformans TaxID=1702242 RepID=A0ABS4NAU4_9THEO|nr:hypothetical protein [Thermoanaerobacterium butyriciformans]